MSLESPSFETPGQLEKDVVSANLKAKLEEMVEQAAPDTFAQAEAFSTIAIEQARAGLKEDAHETLEGLENEAETFDTAYTCAKLYVIAGKTYKMIGNEEKAREAFGKAIEIMDNSPITESLWDRFSAELADVYLKLGMTAEAEDLADHMNFESDYQKVADKIEDYKDQD